ncbi:tyrosine-type recombinase/integrase [Streptomyces vinaceus]
MRLPSRRVQTARTSFLFLIHTAPKSDSEILCLQHARRQDAVCRDRRHAARHGCATLLFAAGVAPRVVMEILGHSQIAVTMNIYTQVTDGSRREAMGHMDRLLRRRRPAE